MKLNSFRTPHSIHVHSCKARKHGLGVSEQTEFILYGNSYVAPIRPLLIHINLLFLF
jgi:hypothetical protein